ncbi:MAG: ABC transporter permease [Planctomycetota bacterium]
MVGAVGMACSLVVAVTCAIGTVQASVESRIVDIVGNADARIVHEFNGRFERKLLEDARGWPEVEQATAGSYELMTVRRADEAVDPETGQPLRIEVTALGQEFEIEQRFRPIEMREGRIPERSGEVMVDPITVEKLDLGIGDRLLVSAYEGPTELEIVGIYERRMLLIALLQGAQIRMQRDVLVALGPPDRREQIDGISLQLREGVDVRAFCDRYGPQLPSYLSLEPAMMLRSGFDRRVRASRLGMIVGSIIAFLSAGFIIVTGMTTAVTERQRELAVLRCIGAQRRQLFLGQVGLGCMIGGTGAVIGIPLGVALAALLTWYFRDLLPAGFRIVPMALVLGLAGSLGAGLLGAAYPAWEASRVKPLSALSRTARPTGVRSVATCAIIGLLLIAVQIGLRSFDDVDTRFWAYVWVGLPLLFVAYFLLAVPILMLITVTLGPALSRVLGLPRGLLMGSVTTTTLRHGFTAGALMVGMALLVGTWAEARAILDDWIGNARIADGFVARGTGLRPEEQQTIDELPFVQQSCPISYLPLRVMDRQVFGLEKLTPPYVVCVGFDPLKFFAINDVTWWEGDIETAIPKLRSGEGILVSDRFTVARGIGIGDRLSLGGNRVRHDYEIVGVVSSSGLEIAISLFGVRHAYGEFAISCVFLDFDTVAEHYSNDKAVLVQVNLDDTIDDEEAKAQVLEAVPGVKFLSARWIRGTIDQIAQATLTIESVIAFCALLLASLGVGNVILANIQARRFEYGVMRAVGASRSILLRLILAEASLLALAGAVTGATLGMHLATISTSHYRELAGLEVTAALPALPTSVGLLVVIVMTLTAAMPGVMLIVRPRPSTLVAIGRNG